MERRGLAAVFMMRIEHGASGRCNRAAVKPACPLWLRRCGRAAGCAADDRPSGTSSCGSAPVCTGLPTCRAAAAASGQCVHGNNLLPKPEPTNFVMTRTFSSGRPNICARTLAQVDHALRGLVQRQRRALPDRGCCVRFKRIVRLSWRDIRLVELDRRARRMRRRDLHGDCPSVAADRKWSSPGRAHRPLQGAVRHSVFP